MVTGFNEKNWLDVAIKKVDQGSEKRYVDSRSAVKVIDEQREAIGRSHETIVNSSKDISIMSTTMVGMAQDLQSYGKEMEYYATKLHQVDNHIEVSFILLCFLLCYQTFSLSWIRIYASIRKHKFLMIMRLKLCKHNFLYFRLCYQTFFSLLDKEFMLPFRSINSL